MLLKITLAAQAAEAIRREIEPGGAWAGSMIPGETDLCRKFGVSRTTIRQALEMLRQEKVVETINGIGTRSILRPGTRTLPATRTVGFLEQEPMSGLKPYQLLWIDELKSLLMRAGHELVIHSSRRPKALEALTEHHPHACWILNRCDVSIQQWFEQRKLPCMVAGVCEGGVELPSVGLDNAALGRHAAGRLLRVGHHRIAILIEQGASAAWNRCLHGFADTLQHRGATLEVLRHGPKPEDTLSLLARVLHRGQRPTAIFVLNPFHYLTAFSYLQQQRLSVPGDLSLITTYGDPFLEFLAPRPCRYDYRPAQYARAVYRMVLAISSRQSGTVPPQRLLIPVFRSGNTIAPPIQEH